MPWDVPIPDLLGVGAAAPGGGSVVHYANGIKLDIRQRDADGHNAASPGTWIEELLDSLRQDLAAS